MARYAYVRGFLDCDFDDVAAIRIAVEAFRGRHDDFVLRPEVVDLYLTGWHFPDGPMNWISHVFYGGSVSLPGVDLVRAQVELLAREFEVEGRFFVDHEEGEREEWLVADGEVRMITSPEGDGESGEDPPGADAKAGL